MRIKTKQEKLSVQEEKELSAKQAEESQDGIASGRKAVSEISVWQVGEIR